MSPSPMQNDLVETEEGEIVELEAVHGKQPTQETHRPITDAGPASTSSHLTAATTGSEENLAKRRASVNGQHDAHREQEQQVKSIRDRLSSPSSSNLHDRDSPAKMRKSVTQTTPRPQSSRCLPPTLSLLAPVPQMI
ncbi:unnamed protein product [Mortierella alpina]